MVGRKIIAWILVYAYLALFCFGRDIFFAGWTWALYLAGGVPLGLAFAKLNFGTIDPAKIAALNAESPENKVSPPRKNRLSKKIAGYLLIIAYLAGFSFWFGVSDSGWAMFSFFLGGIPLSLALKKLGF